MLPTVHEFKRVAEAALAEQVHWARKRFCLPALSVNLRITDEHRSYLGQASVTRDNLDAVVANLIQLSNFMFINYEQVAVSEYRHFNGHPVVGGFVSGDWNLGVRALVAHELAHVIQYNLRRPLNSHTLLTGWVDGCPVFGTQLGMFNENHGSFFQNIYALLRIRWINDEVSVDQYTSPPVNFNVPPNTLRHPEAGPLAHIWFQGKRGRMEVLGRHANPRKRLWCYVVRDPSGEIFEAMLSQLYRVSDDIRAAVDASAVLSRELVEHQRALERQRSRDARRGG